MFLIVFMEVRQVGFQRTGRLWVSQEDIQKSDGVDWGGSYMPGPMRQLLAFHRELLDTHTK